MRDSSGRFDGRLSIGLAVSAVECLIKTSKVAQVLNVPGLGDW